MTEDNLSDYIAELDNIAERWLDDGRLPPLSRVPNQVYHYTNAGGLLGMLESGRVWLTDFRFLNDKSEFIYTNELIDKVLDQRSSSKNLRTRKFIEHVKNYRNIEESYDAFVFSLSERRDDLSQWRGYAQDGLGFTLGFDARKLYDFSNSAEGDFNFSVVEYDNNNQVSVIDKAFDDFTNYVNSNNLNDKMNNKAAAKFEWMATSRGAVNKHASFSSECEWRVYCYNSKNDPAKLVKVRASDLKLIPYVEMSLSKNKKLPLKSIGVGPGFTDASIKNAVLSAIRQHGYDDVEIYSADTPYRRA